MDIKVRGSNGAQFADGDSVALIRDLKLKGSSTALKRGTVISDEIEGRTGKVKGLVQRTEILKKGMRGIGSPFVLRKPIFESML
jgi:protein PhnA